MVFEFDDYKSLLRHLLDEKKRNIKGFALHKLAKACRIQKTYLSRVLNCVFDKNACLIAVIGKGMIFTPRPAFNPEM